MAQSEKCPDCYRPLVVTVHPDHPNVWYLFCNSPACNPLSLDNLRAKPESDDSDSALEKN